MISEWRLAELLYMLVLQWVDTHSDSKQLRMQDQLSIPWQRLMRYRLLLKGVLRHTEPTSYDSEHRLTIINQRTCVKLMVDRPMCRCWLYSCALQARLHLLQYSEQILPPFSLVSSPIVSLFSILHLFARPSLKSS